MERIGLAGLQEFEPGAFNMRNSLAMGHPGPMEYASNDKARRVRDDSKRIE